jgi:hypothetical protein
MKYLILILTLALISFSLISAENKQYPFIFEQSSYSPQLENKSTKLELNRSYSEFAFDGVSKEIKFERFPVALSKYNAVTLKLSSNSIDENTVWVRNSMGIEEAYHPKPIYIYQGYINNEPDSKILLTYSCGNIFAYIYHGDGSLFSIVPDLKTNEIMQIHYVLSGAVTEEMSPYLCLTPEHTFEQTEQSDYKKIDYSQLAPSKLIEIKVACEATSEFYELFANLDKATAYMVSAIAHTSKIYEENLNVRLKISYTLVWENSELDPYRSENLLSDKLWTMPSLWENKKVDRAITVLFASLIAQKGGEGVAGIAMGGEPGKGNLCNPEYGYCVLGIRGGVLFPTTNYCWDVNVAAHEIGHLFGSPHTHSCYWNPPVDTCVTRTSNNVGDACIKTGMPIPRSGTIMSYCHLTNSGNSVELKFHNKEIPLMRKAAVNASCSYEVPIPYVSLLEPLGGQIYKAGEQISIRWTSSRLSYVSIMYSDDNGYSWKKIADRLRTSDSIYIWDTPIINSSEIIVLIHDADDVTVDDRSLVKFSILKPKLTIRNPLENDEFAQHSEISIEWTAVFSDNVTIQFSSDNGSSWTTIADTGFISGIKWKAPEIVSYDCFIKIISNDVPELSIISGKFKIGLPVASLISPNGNEELCVNRTQKIVWQSEFVNQCYLDYSTDAGTSWRKVTLVPLDAKKLEYDWTVPDKVSDSCLIRISTKTNDLLVLDYTDNTFKIKECPLAVDDSHLYDNSISIIPNPANNIITLKMKKVDCNHTNSLKITVYTLEGKAINEINNANINSSAAYELDVSSLDAGNYLVLVELCNYTSVSKFSIVR